MPNQYINKVVYGGSPLIDLTDTTATAADVAQGVYFYLASGERVQGSASVGGGDVWQDAQGYVHLDEEGGGSSVDVEPLSVTQNGTYTAPAGTAYSPVTVNVSGGGGLEYETGSVTLNSDTDTLLISFSNTHTTAPFYYTICLDSNSYQNVQINLFASYYNYHQAFGNALAPSGQDSFEYGMYHCGYRTSAGSSAITKIALPLQSSYTDQSASTVNQSRYWATETQIKGYANSTTRYWRAGYTYNWVAVWTPEH